MTLAGGECFYAWQGGGAYVNGERMEVSSVRQVEDAFVVTELPYNSDRYARTGEHLIHELYGRVAGHPHDWFRCACHLLCGCRTFDAWLEAFIGKWDFSAAALMVLEAGGKVTDFLGNENFIEGHHIIATNGPLHPLFLRLVRERCHSDTVLIALLHFFMENTFKAWFLSFVHLFFPRQCAVCGSSLQEGEEGILHQV